MVLGNFQRLGVLQIRKIVAQGPTVRAGGAGGSHSVLELTNGQSLYLNESLHQVVNKMEMV